ASQRRSQEPDHAGGERCLARGCQEESERAAPQLAADWPLRQVRWTGDRRNEHPAAIPLPAGADGPDRRLPRCLRSATRWYARYSSFLRMRQRSCGQTFDSQMTAIGLRFLIFLFIGRIARSFSAYSGWAPPCRGSWTAQFRNRTMSHTLPMI